MRSSIRCSIRGARDASICGSSDGVGHAARSSPDGRLLAARLRGLRRGVLGAEVEAGLGLRLGRSGRADLETCLRGRVGLRLRLSRGTLLPRRLRDRRGCRRFRDDHRRGASFDAQRRALPGFRRLRGIGIDGFRPSRLGRARLRRGGRGRGPGAGESRVALSGVPAPAGPPVPTRSAIASRSN